MKLFVLSASLLLASSAAAAVAGDEAFASSLSDGAGQALAEAEKAKWSRSIAERLGPFEQLLRAPGGDAAGLASALKQGLDSGRYDSLILGESHGEPAEQEAAGLFLHAVARPGAILFEQTQTSDGSTQYIYKDTAWLPQAGLKVLGYRDHFNPEKDVKAGLKAARRGLLISYTGSAHSAKAVKDYIIYTLDNGLGPYRKGGKDMTTVEDVFLKEHRKPVIVSMVTEAFILERIQALLLKEISTSAGITRSLEAAAAAWQERFAGLPEPRGIRFTGFAGHDGLFVGLTPGPRRPGQLAAALQVLKSRDFEDWLGESRIKSVSAGHEGATDGSGRVISSAYRVWVSDKKGRTFSRLVPDPTPSR